MSLILYSSLAFLSCSQRPSSPPQHSCLCSGSTGPCLGDGFEIFMTDGPLPSRSRSLLQNCQMDFSKSNLLPPHGMSTLLSVVCHDLDFSLIYTTPLGPQLCCTKESSGDAVSTPTASGSVSHPASPLPGWRTPALLSPGTAHTSLWGWHRESFPGLVFMHCSPL